MQQLPLVCFMNVFSEGEQYKSGKSPAVEMCVEDARGNPVTFLLGSFSNFLHKERDLSLDRY